MTCVNPFPRWHSSTGSPPSRTSAGASASHAGGRRVDRWLLSFRRQYAPGASCAACSFGGAVGKDIVSRVWRKVKSDWETWNARSLADEPIVRLILDGTVVRVRLDREATSI
jgi:hypothetical protein